MRTEEEIKEKIKELYKADLDRMVTEEVDYGKFWLRWVLGEREHETFVYTNGRNKRDIP